MHHTFCLSLNIESVIQDFCRKMRLFFLPILDAIGTSGNRHCMIEHVFYSGLGIGILFSGEEKLGISNRFVVVKIVYYFQNKENIYLYQKSVHRTIFTSIKNLQ